LAVIAVGFTFALIGILKWAHQATRRERRTAARNLIISGFVIFVIGGVLAHVGPLLWIIALPMLLIGIVLAAMPARNPQ
jgi:uncharacterized membrane protein YoaK (UPF0700 family)